MVALRTRSKGAEFAPFGLAALLFLLGSTGIGHQELAAPSTQQASADQDWREHLAASPAAAIRPARFNFPRPIGSSIPESEGVRLASFDPDEMITGTLPNGAGRVPGSPMVEPLAYPSVNRSSKGDRLVPAARPQPAIELAPDNLPGSDRKPSEPDTAPGPGARNQADEPAAARGSGPVSERDLALSRELHSPDLSDAAEDESNSAELPPPHAEDAARFSTARLFFDAGPLGLNLAAIEPWRAGEEPVLMLPRASGDPDLKRAVTGAPPGPAGSKTKDGREGVTVAGKGEVTGEGRRPKTPAEHLALYGKARAKAEKCLANAVYFESRSEPVRGQIGVAQVVLNRVFSGFYPDDVCGVVYQNANRYLSCQFTFACDGIPDVVTEPEEWERAKRIARETLDGKLWLKDVGKATHYHASYVYPYWVRSMRKMSRIGLHTFYRPRAWGDGSDEISWGSPVATADAAARL